MTKHELKFCPRCTTRFECKVGDVAKCQCTQVNIYPETKEFLQNTLYEDCLCKGCLAEIDLMVQYGMKHSFPRQKELMVEGLHYYIDEGLFVFTELYHVQRGYCCKNKCRHCAYGNKK